MPPRWQPAALAALLEAGPPWLALVRLVRPEREIGEHLWSVDLLESRRALPRGWPGRRARRRRSARFASSSPDLAPGALLAIGGGAARSLSVLLWVEVASPVASRAEGRAFLDECERALDAFAPEPIVSIDPGLAATYHGHPPADRWAGVLLPLPAPIEGDSRAEFGGDDPEHLSLDRALVVSLPELRGVPQLFIAFAVLVRDAAGLRVAAAAVETDESARSLFLLRSAAAMRALASAAPAGGSAEARDRSPGAPPPARLDIAPRVTLRLLLRLADHAAHARVESVSGPVALLRAGDLVTVCAADETSRDALHRALTPLGSSGIAGAIQGESALPAGARRRLLDATLAPAEAFRWSLSDPTVREEAGAGVVLLSLREIGDGALDPARCALGEGGIAAAAVQTPGADYEGRTGVVVWTTDDGGRHWHPLPMAAEQTWNPLRRCHSWPPSWLDRISLSDGPLAIEWEDPWLFEQPTYQWRAVFHADRQRWRIQRRAGG
jgi:hypothetical protein